jgi:hypothetical protein
MVTGMLPYVKLYEPRWLGEIIRTETGAFGQNSRRLYAVLFQPRLFAAA